MIITTSYTLTGQIEVDEDQGEGVEVGRLGLGLGKPKPYISHFTFVMLMTLHYFHSLPHHSNSTPQIQFEFPQFNSVV